MQFKYPELLYALFLLLIPIFIHLFQLRRFTKVDFTNVAFLKKVTLQTRKSSRLKKWLTLLMRLLALVSIIIAFAQPFTVNETTLDAEKEIVIYVDNSFSMQAKGSQGALLKRASQDLFTHIFPMENISWFTNDIDRKNVSIQDFKSEILSIEYSNVQLKPSEVILRAEKLFSKNKDTEKRLIYISDFQLKAAFPKVDNHLVIDVVPLKPVQFTNILIDTAYVASKTPENIKLNVQLKAFGEITGDIPVSLYNNNALIAKSGVNFSQSKSITVTFDIGRIDDFIGRFELNDANIPFDNSLHFTINSPNRINVLSINDSPSNYIQRLFDRTEFNYLQQNSETLNYGLIPDQNFIVLNELKKIPPALITSLKSFSESGGSLLIIPSEESNLKEYNALINLLSLGSFTQNRKEERKITQIIYDHPIFKDVFEKRVINFQYPKVNSFYRLNSNATPILMFEDGGPFIVGYKNSYLFTGAINTDNSNFQNSPLIVPTLYNMAQYSLLAPDLYYIIGEENKFSVPIHLNQDEIVKIEDSIQSFIPLQLVKEKRVDITTFNEPSQAGSYQVKSKEEIIQNISYNYSRNESTIQYANIENWKGINTHLSIEKLFEYINEKNSINSFWKWFIIFAVIFLMLEMLILKYYK